MAEMSYDPEVYYELDLGDMTMGKGLDTPVGRG